MRMKVSILMFASLLFLTAFSAHAQGLTQAVAGPSGDQFRIIVTMAPQTPEDTYKLQSFILSAENVRTGQQPSWFALDLTLYHCDNLKILRGYFFNRRYDTGNRN